MVDTVRAYLTCRAFVGGIVDSGIGNHGRRHFLLLLCMPQPHQQRLPAAAERRSIRFTRHLVSELQGDRCSPNVIHPVMRDGRVWRRWKRKIIVGTPSFRR